MKTFSFLSRFSIHAIICLSIFLLADFNLTGQTTKDIRISHLGEYAAYVKNADSLFIREFVKGKEIFVADGMSKNGNQRFLNWSQNDKHLIYQNGSGLFKYDVASGKSDLLLDTEIAGLYMFRFYLIMQTDLSTDNYLYFSADPKDDDSQNLVLYRINIDKPKLELLVSDTMNIGNLSVSGDGKYLAYSCYQIAGGWKSGLKIFNTQSRQTVCETTIAENSFFHGIGWSEDQKYILIRNVLGKEQVFQFDSAENTLNAENLDWTDGLSLISFTEDSKILTLEKDDSRKIYSRVDLFSQVKDNIDSGFEIMFAGYSANDKGEPLYFFVEENRVTPPTLIKLQKDSDNNKKSYEKYPLFAVNRLEKAKFKTLSYSNGGDKLSSVYLYYPTNYDSLEQKKYPLITIVYGGFGNYYPDFNYFLYNKIFKYLDLGYFIAFVNTRGIGSEQQNTGYGSWQLEDTGLALNELKKSVNISEKRIYAVGHSHGATMVYYYLTHSNLFAGGIAINGAADWKEQAGLGSVIAGLPDGLGTTPEKDPELYSKESPIENIENMTGDLLMIGGALDTQIPADINMTAFYPEAKKLGKKVSSILFEDEGHLIVKEKNLITMWDEIDKFLK